MYVQWGEHIICILPCKRVVSFVGIVIMRGCMGRRPKEDHVLDSQQTCFLIKVALLGVMRVCKGIKDFF